MDYIWLYSILFVAEIICIIHIIYSEAIGANNPDSVIIHLSYNGGLWFQVFKMWLLYVLYGLVTLATAVTFNPQCGFFL